MKAAVFDFYGTLARAVSWGPRYDEVLAAYGLVLDDAAHRAWTAEIFDGQDHRAHSRTRDDYRRWELARLRRLAMACGGEDDCLEAVVADLHAASKEFTMDAYPEVPEVLAHLKRSGVVVAVCSNWDWDLDRALVQSGLAHLVDVAVSSARVGVRKPHPEIFRHTLERCGVEAHQALFAGDTWYPDVEGPLAAGMQSVHVCRADAPGPARPLPTGVVRIPDLRPFTDLLAS